MLWLAGFYIAVLKWTAELRVFITGWDFVLLILFILVMYSRLFPWLSKCALVSFDVVLVGAFHLVDLVIVNGLRVAHAHAGTCVLVDLLLCSFSSNSVACCIAMVPFYPPVLEVIEELSIAVTALVHAGEYLTFRVVFWRCAVFLASSRAVYLEWPFISLICELLKIQVLLQHTPGYAVVFQPLRRPVSTQPPSLKPE